VPIVPEVEPPEELFTVPSHRCFGLRITPEKLNDIRIERLKALGLNSEANYANISRIKQELDYFNTIIDKIGCRVVDVSNKAVEESANLIYNLYQGKTYK
jgi:regulator of PEP synthase PpsR (kinase-PPPase family)